MKHRTVRIFLPAIILATILAGCITGAPPARDRGINEKSNASEMAEAPASRKNAEIKLAIVSSNQANPLFYDLEKGARETAAALGVSLDWYAPETFDPVKEVEMIEQAVNSGISAIGIVPYDEALTTTMQAISERGIHVGIINNDAISYKGLEFVCGTPQYDIGYDAGEIAADCLTDKGRTYTIAIIECDTGKTGFSLRVQGFQDALSAHNVKYQVIDRFPCNDDTAIAVEAVETFTADTPDLDLWFFAGGWPLFVDIASEPHLSAWHMQDDRCCVSIDALPTMEAFFEAGLCDGVVGQDYYEMGRQTVENLVKLVKGEALPVPDRYLDYDIPFYSTDTRKILPENYKEAFAEMMPWT